jgi:hypothetical protein
MICQNFDNTSSYSNLKLQSSSETRVLKPRIQCKIFADSVKKQHNIPFYMSNTSIKLTSFSNKKKTIQLLNKIMSDIGFVKYLHECDSYSSENEILFSTNYIIYFNNKQIIIRLCLLNIQSDIFVEFTNMTSTFDFYALYRLIINHLYVYGLTHSVLVKQITHTFDEKNIDKEQIKNTYELLYQMTISDCRESVTESITMLYNLINKNNNFEIMNEIDSKFIEKIVNYLFVFNEQVDYIVYKFCLLTNINELLKEKVRNKVKKNITKTLIYDDILACLLVRII